MARTSTWLARVALGLTLATGTSACGASGKPTATPAQIADQRLSGNWRLQRFMPEVALDLPLQGLLMAQMGSLVVTFSAGQYTAAGVGVNLTGRYSVTSAEGDSLELVLYDPDNIPHRFQAQFLGNSLSFHSADKPWKGDGTLQRS